MGYKTKRYQTTRVDLPDGYWVDVAPLTKAEDDECQQALLGGLLETAVTGGTSDIRAKLHQREYTDQLLLRAIKAWNIDGDDGAIISITLDAIQGLAGKDSDTILAVVRGTTNPLATANGTTPSP